MNGLSVKRVDCAENEEGMLKIREWSVELRQWDSGTVGQERESREQSGVLGTGYGDQRTESGEGKIYKEKTWTTFGFKVTSHLRVSLGKNFRTRASFTKFLAKYTSEESLITAIYDKKYHFSLK